MASIAEVIAQARLRDRPEVGGAELADPAIAIAAFAIMH
jgi:hypothetical protein